ncbi:MAG: hypothetical protein SPH68_03275 [Candidatus Borkfalkiaceae bacterium]|nr:hypothetical protein [Clostridia bacterium]MDY6223166.1 hypothetical protein [Christensenellaceae bacterium]
MKEGKLKKLYLKIRCFFLGVAFPLEDRLFCCSGADRQGALAQSREGDCLQIVHVKVREKYAAIAYSIPLNRIIGCAGKQLTQDLLRLFKSGFCLDGEIAAIRQDENGKLRCEIRIFDSAAMMSPYLEDLPYLTSFYNE